MKNVKYLVLLILATSAMTIPIGTAYEPRENKISMVLYSDEGNVETLIPGMLVNVTFVLKNFKNETMNKVNITHKIPIDLFVAISPAGAVTEDKDVNVTEGYTYTQPDNKTIDFLSVYANTTYYSLSFENLEPSEKLIYQISFNASIARTINLSPPTVKYLDKWGDVQKFTGGNTISIKYQNPPDEDPTQKHFPLFDVAETNWTLVISISVGVAVIAVLSKVLYGKRPF